MNVPTKPETSARSIVGNLFLRMFAGIGVLATIALLWLGYSNFWPSAGHSATDIKPLVPGEVERTFSAGDRMSGVVRAGLLKFGPGQIDVAPGSVLIADEVRLDDKTVLRAPSLIILARRMTGGRVDASGREGEAPGAQGEPGGSVTIVAAQLQGTAIDARGGAGARGATGSPGANGRDGRCEGFGGYRGSDRGGDGSPGQAGGDGGLGGNVVLLLTVTSAPTVNVAGGAGGLGGAGGAAGRGGRGCIGLGGSQGNQSDGRPGPDGTSGKPGPTGTVTCREVALNELRSIAEASTSQPELLKPFIARHVGTSTRTCL